MGKYMTIITRIILSSDGKTEAYSEPCQTPNTELLAEIVSG